MASLYDVARKAGVSYATASRVANSNPIVSAEAAAKVHKAMAELEYSLPKPEKRRGPKINPKLGFKFRTVCLMMIGAHQDLNFFGTQFFQVIQDMLKPYKVELSFIHMPDPGEIPVFCRHEQFDGFILAGQAPVGRARTILQRKPLVWMLTRRDRSLDIDYVEPANHEYGDTVLDYFAGHNCRSIAFFNYYTFFEKVMKIRLSSFESAAKRLGITFKEFKENNSQFTYAATAAQQVARLLESKTAPDGIYVADSNYATYLYPELERNGISLGDKILLCEKGTTGEQMPNLQPVPAFLNERLELCAVYAAELLIKRITGPDSDYPVGLTISPVVES